MRIIEGKSVFSGIAIGKISIYRKEQITIKRHHIDNTEVEFARLEQAKELALEELRVLYDKALKEVGESGAMIFEVHQMMLEDIDYLDAIKNIIQTQQLNAEFAVAETGDNFSAIFSEMEDEYMKERAADVKDISERLIRKLQGKHSTDMDSNEPVIIAADDLAPSETVQMDKNRILAFVTRFGSSNSHTAILARTMNIPALIQVDFPEDADGCIAIVDGVGGNFIINPEEEILTEYRKKQQDEADKKSLLQNLKGKETETKSGKKINLYANIGSLGDVGSVLANDAAGIGLFRSEFLYLENDHYPTENEQFEVYRKVAEMMAGKKVIIRTLDIGADKQIDYFNLDKEENPALGYRAIRICLTREDIFRTQLRALLRASAYGNIAIMYPMIISLSEVKEIKRIVGEVKEELRSQNIPFAEVEEGIMIETPAAAVISDLLAKEVDFFSLGTNDLTQYTLAMDRQNAKLESMYDPHHEAVLRLIQLVIDNAHKAGIWAGICGELGADLSLTETFVNMGVDELSVSPSMILPVRQNVRNMD